MVRKISFLIVIVLFIGANAMAQNQAFPWNKDQLMAPKTLSDKITANQTKDMLILCIGYQADIPGSVDIGPAGESANLTKLREYLKNVDKNKEVIIYCGCCPYSKCPNVQPAFNLLKELGFTNAKLLDLPDNIKTDWLDKGYPTTDD